MPTVSSTSRGGPTHTEPRSAPERAPPPSHPAQLLSRYASVTGAAWMPAGNIQHVGGLSKSINTQGLFVTLSVTSV